MPRCILMAMDSHNGRRGTRRTLRPQLVRKIPRIWTIRLSSITTVAVCHCYSRCLPDGTSVLTYSFASPVTDAIDIFITDVDRSDAVSVSAFDADGNALDMRQWSLLAEGDLSNFKDTGSAFSNVEAPAPTTTFSVSEISLTAVNNTNYNRSYSILRTSDLQPLSSVEITFTGQQNSPSRALPSTGSHIYVAVSTASAVPDPVVLLGDCNRDNVVNFSDIGPFIAILSAGDYLAQADTNEDEVIDFSDIGPLITLLSS